MAYKKYNRSQGYPQNYGVMRHQEEFKKSGAVYSKIKKGNFEGSTIINAWNVSKSKGLITCTVAPYHKTAVHTSEKGHEFQTMIAVVKYERSGVEKRMPCTMNLDTKVISLSEIGMCITPNGKGYTKSGKRVTGYFGTFRKR